MSKMSELSQVLEEMIVCGEGMIKAANTLKDIRRSLRRLENCRRKIQQKIYRRKCCSRYSKRRRLRSV